MDETLRNQLTGVVIWFLVLILLVGSWQPVRFSPDRMTDDATEKKTTPVVVDTPLTIPETAPVKRLPERTVAEKPSVASVVKEKPQADEQPKPSLPQRTTAPGHRVPAPQADRPAGTAGKTTVHDGGRQAKAARHTGWLVKVVTYYTARQANDLVARLNEAGYDATYRVFKTRDGRRLYSVRIGPYASRSQARRIKKLVDRRFRTNSIVERISREKN
ncbi:SPOR domain-containing protein [Sulfurivirga sp.]|uniref:SPOR domain-containing protein n=1 Tax=Sulfurivirga sp. TaxID=2614236 RepID=UPI0025CC89F3|nr:SPOR domain-containing protein [Sulfurivirga sp.]